MEQVDNRLAVETPEGVEFEMELAGIAVRGVAHMIDLALKGVVISVAALVLELLGGVGQGLMLLLMFALFWMYGPLFEVFMKGQTPGKMAFGVRVVNRDGTPVGWFGSIVRNLIRVVDALPFGYVAGVIAMVLSGRFQRLGDLAADTVVVYQHEKYASLENRLLGMVPAEPVQLSVALSPEEQEAIVDFGERARFLGPARSEELAEILSPVTGATSGPEAAQTLFGVAQRIVKWG